MCSSEDSPAPLFGAAPLILCQTVPSFAEQLHHLNDPLLPFRCDTVQPSSSLHVPIPFTPTQAGTKRLTVHLSCTQIQDIKGYRSVNIVAAQPPA